MRDYAQRSRQYAFVTFENAESAERALAAAARGLAIDGREIEVREC